MGDAADVMLEGACCATCGEYFHDGEEPGHPRYCSKDCEPDGFTPPRSERNKKKNERRKRARARRLADADTSAWVALTQYHFRRVINGEALDWWPSSGKYFYRGKIIDAKVAEKVLKGVK